jgi:hypothetical protein
MPITRIVKAISSLVFWRAATLFARRRKIEGASTEMLRTYFGNPDNFCDKPINKLVKELGWWQKFDDWDLGRHDYIWLRPDLRVTVGTRGDTIAFVVYGNPMDRHGLDELIWKRPGFDS